MLTAKHGGSGAMNDEDRADYEELIKARDTLEQQIADTQYGSPYYSTNRGSQIGDVLQKMKDELAEIKEIIANIEAGNAQGS